MNSLHLLLIWWFIFEIRDQQKVGKVSIFLKGNVSVKALIWLENDRISRCEWKSIGWDRAVKQAFPFSNFRIIIRVIFESYFTVKESSLSEIRSATCRDVSFSLLCLTRFVMWLLMGWSTCVSMLLPPLPRTQRLPSPLTMSTTSGESFTSPRSSPLPSWTGHPSSSPFLAFYILLRFLLNCIFRLFCPVLLAYSTVEAIR